MDNVKIGSLIRKLRREKRLTQMQLAKQLNVSDKAISKWERGLGCPDVSLLADLSAILAVDVEGLLSGELGEKEPSGGNVKRMNFYVCPACGNIVAAMADTGISCCGKKLKALQAKKAEEGEKLHLERIEDEFFLTSDHPMTREHSIAFLAFLTTDTMLLWKQYPEWNLEVRLPFFAHGRLFWYCTRHGLFYQEI